MGDRLHRTARQGHPARPGVSTGQGHPTRPGRLAAAAGVLAALVAAALLLWLRDTEPRIPQAAPPPGAGALAFAVAGDSITADGSPAVAARAVGNRSWVRFAQGGGAAFAGGWARDGATTAEMAAALAAHAPPPGSVNTLVILAGTNDIYRGVPFTAIAENLKSIAARVGAPRVVVCSIPPRDGFAAPTEAYNAWLPGFASGQGWEWTDASAGLRDAMDPGRFGPGLSHDGVHPSRAGAAVLGTAIRAALLATPEAGPPEPPQAPEATGQTLDS
ncbi:hypothetical protein NCCP1664_21190 [Zafaria cholistanensis]|uniref:SGNH hydrolase-type esterase domain-containing protein n=1 Tax=Zafaria cholistanensis TaxID=1682741 RepID=A0A5A7NRT9_9MICC|nr:GDSL-type esterase/lipase family protein [Zafaria cholistanensis]GER23624.1 hypothetical protein NCCP1664_21190 [Zafaria cholistanensis]